MYNYYDLISAVNALGVKIDTLISLQAATLKPILFTLIFILLLKVGFSSKRGYRL